MHHWTWIRRRPMLFRRITVIVMLCAYLVTGFGVPVAARVDKSGEPFPCQGHACGCHSAEQCWRECCCFSKAEKLAWAKRHNVRPPAYANEPATDEELHGACCSERSGSEHQKSAPEACCDRVSKRTRRSEVASGGEIAADEREAETSIVLVIRAAKCRSIATMWCVLGVSLPPPVIGWQFEWTMVEWLRPRSLAIASLDRIPPVPPPCF